MSLRIRFSNRFQLIILFTSLFVFFCIVSFIPEATAGGGDDISHYNIARNAFKFPRLLLDLWGKPVFTLLSSPFAQFGLHGMQFFNIILSLAGSYLLILIARESGYENAWLVVPFTCFAPLYTSMISTGMTEILFGFFLVVSAYLFMKGRYIGSSLIISFIPFVRNEGIIILLIYLCAFLLYRKWKPIPFLLTGILVLSLAGFFYFNDLLWIIHKWPYGDTSGIYGHGDLFYFIQRYKWITGIPLGIAFLAGLLHSLFRFSRKLSLRPSPLLTEFMVILGPMGIYFLAHSYAWWKGTMGSGGETRLLTSIIPLTSIYSLQGINLVLRFFNRNIFIKWLIIASFLYFVVLFPFRMYPIPYRLTEEQQLAQEAGKWLKENALGKGLIYYCDPHIQYFLGVNYYDQNQIKQYLPHPEDPSRDIPGGSFIAWDAHYLANEGRVSKNSLFSDSTLILVKEYHPAASVGTLGGNDYELLIFRKD